jgi:hypothetical protein
MIQPLMNSFSADFNYLLVLITPSFIFINMILFAILQKLPEPHFIELYESRKFVVQHPNADIYNSA